MITFCLYAGNIENKQFTLFNIKQVPMITTTCPLWLIDPHIQTKYPVLTILLLIK